MKNITDENNMEKNWKSNKADLSWKHLLYHEMITQTCEWLVGATVLFILNNSSFGEEDRSIILL